METTHRLICEGEGLRIDRRPVKTMRMKEISSPNCCLLDGLGPWSHRFLDLKMVLRAMTCRVRSIHIAVIEWVSIAVMLIVMLQHDDIKCSNLQ